MTMVADVNMESPCAMDVDVDLRYGLMSRRRRRLLRRSRRLLRKNVNPAGHLMDACLTRSVLTRPDVELIRSAEGGWSRQVLVMSRCMKRRPEAAFDGFVWALRDTNQGHVAEALLGNGGNLMTNFHRNILKKSRVELIRNVNPAGHLLDALLSNGAITLEDEELIRGEGTRGWKSQVGILLDCLLRRPDHAFDGFVQGLILTDQQHIASLLLNNGLRVTVKLNLKRKRSEDETSSNSIVESIPSDDEDIRSTIDRLIENGLSKIQNLLSKKKKKEEEKGGTPPPELTGLDQLELESVERLVDLLENFRRRVVSATRGSIELGVVCGARESVWDLRILCGSEAFVGVCRSALIPDEWQTTVDVEVTVDEATAGRCVDHLDRYLPPPPSPLDGSSFLPPEILHTILHRVLSARETGNRIGYEDIAGVCKTWKTVLGDGRFQRAFKRFVESSMRPYIYEPVLLASRIAPPPSAHPTKAIIGVCVIGRCLYVARTETPRIEVYSIPDLTSSSYSSSSSSSSSSVVPDHEFLRSIDLSWVEMPFNMAASEPSRCLYLTDFARQVGCVWKVSAGEGAAALGGGPPSSSSSSERKFADDVGRRPIGISVSRDDYVIVVSEEPNAVRVFTRLAEPVLSVPLSSSPPGPLSLEAPRQAVCTVPGRIALIHGYLEPLNRVVELSSSGGPAVIVHRCYGSTMGPGWDRLHWPAALACDARGRMLVADRENRRVHLVGADFRLRRHLVRSTGAKPRRLCLDDTNGVLYVGHTDPTISVYRVSYPGQMTSCIRSNDVNCFRALGEKEPLKASTQPNEDKTSPETTSKTRFVLPPAGPYRPTRHLNRLPVELLQTIFLKAASIEDRSRIQSTLVGVCRQWYNIVGVMHFRYRLVRFVKGHRDCVKRRTIILDE